MLGRTNLFGLMDSIMVLIATSQSSVAVPNLKESFSASLRHGHACLCSWIPTIDVSTLPCEAVTPDPPNWHVDP
jgi:hypothetical protein